MLQLSPSPATTPVTAWFNGGPGCSSLEGGFQEMGALFVDEADPTKLVANPFAWTNISSMLFIEAPACVGYSYADTLAGCSHNDSSQAVDNAAALRVFFSLYPELAANDFFITGESVRLTRSTLRPPAALATATQTALTPNRPRAPP